ncbi:MAG: hypothetical protein HY657_15305 [Acidobacteria bacterium]|nr:hypothetical protein [Acidobacteriota bacterium]
MAAKIPTIAAVVPLGIVSTLARAHAGGTAEPAQAGTDCVAQLDQFQSRAQALQQEIERQSLDFAVDSTIDVVIGDAKDIVLDTTTPPTLARAAEVEDYRARITAWDSVAQVYGVTMEDLLRCLTPGSGCNIFDFAMRQNQALRRWIESLADSGTQGAINRVRDARDLFQGWTSQSTSLAIGSTTAAVNCMNDYVYRARSVAGDPVDLRDPAPSQPSQPAGPPQAGGGGIGAGTIAAIVAAGVGIPVAVKVGLDAAERAGANSVSQSGSSSGSSGSGGGSSSQLLVAAQSQFSCTAPSALNNTRTCTGIMQVRTGPPLVPGTSYVLVTAPSQFVGQFVAAATGSFAGGINMRLQTGSACPPVQTQAGIYLPNQITTSIAAVTITPAMPPISCGQ